MAPRRIIRPFMSFLIVLAALSPRAVPAPGGKALWIEVTEKGSKTTTIAMTEEVARRLLLTEEFKVNFTRKGERHLITKEMLRSVLDDEKDLVQVRDDANGTDARLYMKSLTPPARHGGKARLVVETYKAGKKEFRIAIPDIEIEEGDGAEGSQTEFGWKMLIPFLAEAGGAVYIHNELEDSEVWVFVD